MGKRGMPERRKEPFPHHRPPDLKTPPGKDFSKPCKIRGSVAYSRVPGWNRNKKEERKENFMGNEIKQHTISVLVENKFGALARIAGLFSGRGYNIESLSVNHTHDPNLSRMTIVTAGTDEILEQIEKQLNKLIDVISVEDVTLLNHIERGLALLKVKTTRDNRSEIIQLVETFRGKVLNIKSDVIYVEISGSPEHIDNFIELMEDFGILEVSRAGRTAIRKD